MACFGLFAGHGHSFPASGAGLGTRYRFDQKNAALPAGLPYHQRDLHHRHWIVVVDECDVAHCDLGVSEQFLFRRRLELFCRAVLSHGHARGIVVVPFTLRASVGARLPGLFERSYFAQQ